jgi:hypothetical protein
LDYSVPITKSITFDASKQINILLGGSRGMGKSWFSMYLTLKLVNLSIPTQLFIIDFKQSDVYRLKDLLPEGRVAGTKEEIFELLEYFVSLMKQRGKFILENTTFGSTANTLGMPLYYLWYDEFGAVTSTLDIKEKKRHDELLSQIALLGRQYNFGLLAIMQQISVSNSGLPSNIKEQFGLIAHLGEASLASYQQSFGNSIEIPKFKIERGQGFLWIQGVTTFGSVQPFASPNLSEIDLWEAFQKAFAKQSDNDYLFFTE